MRILGERSFYVSLRNRVFVKNLVAFYAKIFLGVWMIGCLIILNFSWAEEDLSSKSPGNAIKDVIVADYKHFYALKSLGHLAAGLGIAGIMAHTNGDREIQNWYQDSIRTEDTDDISKVVKRFGGGRTTIPLFAGVAVLGELTKNTKVGSLSGGWAKRTLRAMLVGAPPLLFFQKAVGASRPDEDTSHWHPFQDDNGVSGHSFMGAVPFLSAAMMADNLYIKSFFYLGSTFCGISRINDDKHYFSQSVLGWWLAYLSARSVHDTDVQEKTIRVTPAISNGAIGLRVSIAF